MRPAMPTSEIFAEPSAAIRTFCDLRSMCTTLHGYRFFSQSTLYCKISNSILELSATGPKGVLRSNPGMHEAMIHTAFGAHGCDKTTVITLD